MATTIDSTKHALERLLRLELAASNSYDSAIRRLEAPAQQGELQDVLRDHDLAIGRLRNLLASMHDAGTLRGIGLVRTLARGISGALAWMGAPAVLRALRSGERALLDRLEDLDGDQRLAPEARALIMDELLPRTRGHVDTLDRLLAAA